MITVNIYSSSIHTPLGKVTLFADAAGLTGIVLPGTDRRELSSWYPDTGAETRSSRRPNARSGNT
jgi:hypothetical protein